MTEKKKYDNTVARIAGNLLSGVDLFLYTADIDGGATREPQLIERTVARARAIVAEVARTEPETGGEGA